MFSVAVAICMYTEDRLDQICAAIESVRAQTRPPDELLLVVDYNEALLTRMREIEPTLQVVPNHHGKGLSGGRNTAAEVSTSEVLVFLDDDARARPQWLERLVEPLADPRVVATGGRVEADWIGAPPRWFPEELLWAVGCSYRGLPSTPTEIRNPFGGCMAVRRQAVLDAGLFREDVGRRAGLPLGCEETEMAIRMTSNRRTIRYVPDAVIDHVVPRERAQFAYLARRCYAEGLSKAIVAKAVGQQSALATERAYVLRVIPAGLGRAVWRALTGPNRVDELRRAGALTGGVCLAAAGYLVGRARRDVAPQDRVEAVVAGKKSAETP